ncbi:hypothetical protein H4582DRAFT_1353161 [Lactarius indigo]|nr:hypothetical protein H4582DRAFT_1353161 [Lactarius indigo]
MRQWVSRTCSIPERKKSNVAQYSRCTFVVSIPLAAVGCSVRANDHRLELKTKPRAYAPCIRRSLISRLELEGGVRNPRSPLDILRLGKGQSSTYRTSLHQRHDSVIANYGCILASYFLNLRAVLSSSEGRIVSSNRPFSRPIGRFLRYLYLYWGSLAPEESNELSWPFVDTLSYCQRAPKTSQSHLTDSVYQSCEASFRKLRVELKLSVLIITSRMRVIQLCGTLRII